MFPTVFVEQSRPEMSLGELNFLVAGARDGLTIEDFKSEGKVVDVHRISNMNFGCKKPRMTFSGKVHVLITADDISHALYYLFLKATAEVKKFVKRELLSKIAFEKNGFLFSRSRLLDGQRFHEAG